ncbi:complement receptor type 2-like [Haemaphysalis longicornis]
MGPLFGYSMAIGTATLEHSGEYSCQAPDGKRHSIKIKVAEVECERLKEFVNGRVVTSPSGRFLAGCSFNFSCLLGHRLVGRQEVVCLGNGRWSDLVPTCEEIENFVPPEGACPRPRIPPGMVVLPDQKWYDGGSKVNFSCDGDRRLVGMPTAECRGRTWKPRHRKCL